MLVPGANLLNMSLRHIQPQKPVMLYRFISRSRDTKGVLVPTRSNGVQIVASVQAVPRQLFDQLGLDRQRAAVTIFTKEVLKDVERDGMGDQIEYAGRLYVVQSLTRWAEQDGWSEGICIEVPATTQPVAGPTPGVFT